MLFKDRRTNTLVPHDQGPLASQMVRDGDSAVLKNRDTSSTTYSVDSIKSGVTAEAATKSKAPKATFYKDTRVFNSKKDAVDYASKMGGAKVKKNKAGTNSPKTTVGATVRSYVKAAVSK